MQEENKCTRSLVGELEERDRLDNVGVDGKRVLKYIFDE
jgi:hypothetical protein